jgi:hypothetical protein
MCDHQHLDAGHFEIVRGSDPLLVDAADYGSYSSLSHNVVLVDDPQQSSDWETSSKKRDIITYKRNQGVWNDTASVARYDDGGGYAYALAEYDSAFNPFGYKESRNDRAVTRAEREMLLSRTPVAGATGESARLVVYDRMTFSDPRFTATFILHGGPAPQVTGPTARFNSGASSAWVTTLLPKGATSSLVDETHNTWSGDRPYFTNKPPDGMTSFRYEVAAPSPRGSTERRFLHAIDVAGVGSAVTAPVAIDEETVAGAAIDTEAYLFAVAGPQARAAAIAYTAPVTATHHIVCDLAPSASYAVTATSSGGGCRVSLAPGGGKTASPSGVLSIDVSGCQVH